MEKEAEQFMMRSWESVSYWEKMY